MREVLILGQLNDGAETTGSDVYRTLQYAQVLLGVELGERLSEQVPDHLCFQGDPGTADADTGIAIRSGIMGVESSHWNRLDPWHKISSVGCLTVRTNFQGCLLSLMATKRPAGLTVEQRRLYAAALSDAVHDERAAGRVPIVGIDANANHTDLEDATWLTWSAPYLTSVVGFLTPGSVQVLACTALQRIGEHPPVIGLVKVPLP